MGVDVHVIFTGKTYERQTEFFGNLHTKTRRGGTGNKDRDGVHHRFGDHLRGEAATDIEGTAARIGSGEAGFADGFVHGIVLSDVFGDPSSSISIAVCTEPV